MSSSLSSSSTLSCSFPIEHIPKIYYINLEKRKDRLEQIHEELTKMDIFQYSERFNAIPTPQFGILGCTKSHCAVMKMALENKYKNILIFEDDFTFLVDKPVFYQELNQIFDANVDFDVVMFAYNIKSDEPCEYPFLTRVKDASTASCYLIRGEYLKHIIELYETAIVQLETTRMHWLFANDAVWKVLMEKDRWFATKTRIGYQRPSFSDNSNEFMNHGC